MPFIRFQATSTNIPPYISALNNLTTTNTLSPTTNTNFVNIAEIHHNKCHKPPVVMSGVTVSYSEEIFLPWHRSYLHFFERQINSSPPNTPVPYINWSGSKTYIKNLLTAIDTQFPLNTSVIPQNILTGLDRESNWITNATDMIFSSTGNINAWAKAIIIVLAKSKFCDFTNALESFHDVVHGTIGGPVYGNGLMSYTETAAYDPIFWLHHSYIDYIWARWQCANNSQRYYYTTSNISSSYTNYTSTSPQSLTTIDFLDKFNFNSLIKHPKNTIDFLSLGYNYSPNTSTFKKNPNSTLITCNFQAIIKKGLPQNMVIIEGPTFNKFISKNAKFKYLTIDLSFTQRVSTKVNIFMREEGSRRPEILVGSGYLFGMKSLETMKMDMSSMQRFAAQRYIFTDYFDNRREGVRGDVRFRVELVQAGRRDILGDVRVDGINLLAE
jgi:hypothetical protein